jgi:hypothetical protein
LRAANSSREALVVATFYQSGMAISRQVDC